VSAAHVPAILALADGTVFRGRAIGAESASAGEVVFNTAMTGYQEILTDPSYAGQIVTLTYPHIGNTGVNPEDVESKRIFAAGLVIRDLPCVAASWRKMLDLSSYLRDAGVAGIADIDTRRNPLHVAIENFGHDANIGGVVRTANAFAVDTVHIVGRRRWNRRGAMVTDRYQRLQHHDTTAELLAFASRSGLTVVAVDNVPGAVRLEEATLPRCCLMVFGQEGPGITDETRAGAALAVSIAQFGSTRSINASVAAGIAMHAWIRQHADISRAW